MAFRHYELSYLLFTFIHSLFLSTVPSKIIIKLFTIYILVHDQNVIIDVIGSISVVGISFTGLMVPVCIFTLICPSACIVS